MKYDVIVVGSGIGGIGCAALLSYAGYKTLVLEKNDRIGGVCSSYNKEGFTIDVAVHFFSQGMRGRFGEILKRVGLAYKAPDGRLVSDHLRFVPNLTGKVKVKFKGVPGYKSMVDFGTPKPKTNKVQKSEVNNSGFKKEEEKEFITVIGSMLQMSNKKINELFDREIDLKSWVDEITSNRKVHDFISVMCGTFFSIPPKMASAAEYIICLQETVFKNDASYPIGGAIAIPSAFAEGVKKYGGEIKTSAKVEKIVVENNRVAGVICDGESIAGKIVVSNAGIKRTVSTLVGEKYFESAYVRRVKDLIPSHSAITFKFALSEPIKELEGIPVVQLAPAKIEELKGFVAEEGERAPKAAGYLATILSNMDPNLAPPGKQLIIFGTVSPPAIKNWKKWCDAYYNDILEYYPELENKKMFVDITTPSDIVKYTGKDLGPVEGTALTPSQSGKRRISSELPIEGLYVVGDTAGTDTHGVGTQLAADSAIKCADMIIAKNHPASQCNNKSGLPPSFSSV